MERDGDRRGDGQSRHPGLPHPRGQDILPQERAQKRDIPGNGRGAGSKAGGEAGEDSLNLGQ